MRCRNCQLAYPVSAEGPHACPACGAVAVEREKTMSADTPPRDWPDADLIGAARDIAGGVEPDDTAEHPAAKVLYELVRRYERLKNFLVRCQKEEERVRREEGNPDIGKVSDRRA